MNEDHGFFSAGERQQCSGAHGKELTVGSTLLGGTSSTAEGVKRVWRNLLGEGVEMIGHKATKEVIFIYILPPTEEFSISVLGIYLKRSVLSNSFSSR